MLQSKHFFKVQSMFFQQTLLLMIINYATSLSFAFLNTGILPISAFPDRTYPDKLQLGNINIKMLILIRESTIFIKQSCQNQDLRNIGIRVVFEDGAVPLDNSCFFVVWEGYYFWVFAHCRKK